MIYKRIFILFFLAKEIEAVTELCSVDQGLTKNAVDALAACQNINSTLWLPITTADRELRYTILNNDSSFLTTFDVTIKF